MKVIVDLDDTRAARGADVGGKAVNLARMRAAGLPVPDGFVVATDAYRSHVGDSLAPAIDALAEVSDVTRAAARLRDEVTSAPVPPDVEAAIRSAYAALGTDVPVAVRSSATAEDLADASFAGQQDTYLGVVGADAVVDAVRRCWASLWTDRAVAYRRSRGIDPGDVALAVVVQRMVDARAAGVMFTANPVTGARGETVVDAAEGLGESVVSGEVDPDRYVVTTATGRCRQRHAGERRLLVRAAPGGGVVRERGAGPARPVLDDSEIAQLTRLGDRVARLYGAPQDIEWALDRDGTWWLTQTRPVTTLFPLVHRLDGRFEDGGRRIFLCGSLAQGLTRPITPLGRSTIRLMTGGMARLAGVGVPDVRRGAPFLAEGGQRVFGDVTAAFRNPLGRRLMRFLTSYMEARTSAALGHLDDDPEFATTGSAARVLAGIARTLVPTGLPAHALVGLRDPAVAAARVADLTDELRHVLDLPDGLDARTRLDAVETVLATRAGPTMPGVVGYCVGGFASLGLVRLVLGERLAPGELQDVLRSVPHNPTTAMDLDLWDLGVALAADPGSREALAGVPADVLAARFAAGTLPPTLQEGLAGFLRAWGDRAVAEIDLGMPRWSDDPAHLFGVLAGYALLDDAAPSPRALFEQGAAAAERTVRELVERAGGPLRRHVVAFLLDRVRRLVGLRESPKFALVTLFAAARRELLSIGDDLVAAGRLDRREDVAFLDVEAIRRGVEGEDLRAVVAAQRAAYDAELPRRRIPRLLLSDGTDVETLGTAHGAEPDADTLVGSPASAGVVTGVARVVSDPGEARLRPGEILVAPSTDPGWTPLFLTAGGLVMEMGGSNSHGAVVAREYGIPAVVGVPDATTRIATGRRVTVDGATGVVTLGPDA